MGDQDGGCPDLVVQPAQPGAQLLADLRVQGPVRLVEERFRTFDATAAYSAGFLLALISLLILGAMSLLTRRRTREVPA